MAAEECGPAREVVDSDIAVLVEVSRRAGALFETCDLHLPPEDPEQTVCEAECVLVVGEPAAGFITVDTVDGAAHIGELAVHPGRGRRGLGSLLLEAAVEHAVSMGRTAMTLTTFRDVPWNGPWYEQRGFAEFPEFQRGPELRDRWEVEIEAGIHLAPRIAMRRELVR